MVPGISFPEASLGMGASLFFFSARWRDIAAKPRILVQHQDWSG
jgi:hypothetical protein